MSRYNDIAKRSFKSKWNLYLFEKFIAGTQQNIHIDDFKKYIIKPEMVDNYTKDYWQNIKSNKMANEIHKWKKENYDCVRVLEKDYCDDFENIFPINDFNNLIKEKECHYCHISLDALYILFDNKQIRKKNTRGWELEIDRCDSNLEYTKDNCVMACYWCNNAKTDEFCETDFIDIGKEIRKIWEQRLLKISTNNSLTDNLLCHITEGSPLN